MWYVSANRDEDVFDDPFRFDITRSPNEHVAFGGGGPHFCLGANLARMELRLLFRELLDRIPDMTPDGRAADPPLQLHRRHQAPAGEVHRRQAGGRAGVRRLTSGRCTRPGDEGRPGSGGIGEAVGPEYQLELLRRRRGGDLGQPSP